MRLHHRCAIYDTLNNYGAHGEDFFAMGYRTCSSALPRRWQARHPSHHPAPCRG